MKPKAVDQPEMGQVEKRLVAVVKDERRGAIWFTVLTVLCTPFLVLLAGFLALALLWFISDQADYEISVKGIYTCVNLFLAGFGYIAMSYGQIVTGSWLWFPPDADEICVAAWILCKLAADEDGSFEVRSTDRRILNLLSQLKFIQIRDNELQLTLKGQDFVAAASCAEYDVE